MVLWVSQAGGAQAGRSLRGLRGAFLTFPVIKELVWLRMKFLRRAAVFVLLHGSGRRCDGHTERLPGSPPHPRTPRGDAAAGDGCSGAGWSCSLPPAPPSSPSGPSILSILPSCRRPQAKKGRRERKKPLQLKSQRTKEESSCSSRWL